MMSLQNGKGEVGRIGAFGLGEPPSGGEPVEVELGAHLRELWAEVDMGWTPERAQRIFGNIELALEQRRRRRRWAQVCLAAFPAAAVAAFGIVVACRSA